MKYNILIVKYVVDELSTFFMKLISIKAKNYTRIAQSFLPISKNKLKVLNSFLSFFNQENEEGDLKNKVDLLQLTLLRVRCETEAEMRRLAREVDEKNQVLRQLRRQLEEQSDYKELQHQARYSPIINY